MIRAIVEENGYLNQLDAELDVFHLLRTGGKCTVFIVVVFRSQLERDIKNNVIQACYSIELRLLSDLIKDLGYFSVHGVRTRVILGVRTLLRLSAYGHTPEIGLQISLVDIGCTSNASLAPNIASSDGCG